LPGFTADSLQELGTRVRGLYVTGATDPDRVAGAVDDDFLRLLVETVSGQFGGKVGVAPRIFVKKVVDVLDLADANPEFVPRRDYPLRISAAELTDAERAVMPNPPVPPLAASVDDIDLTI
jgi:hypothetical protein